MMIQGILPRPVEEEWNQRGPEGPGCCIETALIIKVPVDRIAEEKRYGCRPVGPSFGIGIIDIFFFRIEIKGHNMMIKGVVFFFIKENRKEGSPDGSGLCIEGPLFVDFLPDPEPDQGGDHR